MKSSSLFSRDNVPPVLAFFYTTAYFALLMAFVFGKVSIAAENRDMFNVLMGVLTGAQATIMNYYFGSSNGSERKNELLASGGKE